MDQNQTMKTLGGKNILLQKEATMQEINWKERKSMPDTTESIEYRSI